jgi:glycosyltransferase involved in cell wall biosynthesis
MRILLAHNFYTLQGGEDAVFSNEKVLLQRHGHEVIEYVRYNNEIGNYGVPQYAGLAARTLWNWTSYAEIKSLIQKHRPDIAHFHNIFPLISPAAYDACVDSGVPVVQTLHNARLFCPQGGLYYRGQRCEACLGKALPWSGILRACYRESHIQSGLVGIMNAAHWRRGTWTDKVNRYIVFTSYFRDKFIQAGLPANKITIKPHGIDDPGLGHACGDYALYAGRLTAAKGLKVLLRAWEKTRGVPLKICGTGELEDEVLRVAAESDGKVQLLPQVPREEVLELIKRAAFLVWPSWGETFGLVALEAFACGKPVIASGARPMSDLVENSCTGIHFQVGDPDDLARQLTWAWEHPEEMKRMGAAARKKYESCYSVETNYEALIGIYTEVIQGVIPKPIDKGEFCYPA